MRAALLAAAGVWGGVWGSFLNVAITRFPWDEESVVRPASHCRSCQAPIAWYDNLPVASWLILRGRCRRCKARVSALYPFVEALSAALCVALVAKAAPASAVLLALTPQQVALAVLPGFVLHAFAAALIVVGFIDLRTQLVPDSISLPGVVLGFGASWWMARPGLASSAIGAAAGAGVVLLFHYGWKALRGFEGMGLGDAKLLAMIGAWLGWEAVVFCLFAGSVQGIAGWAIGRRALEAASTQDEKERPAHQVPLAFGPFLALAALEFLVAGDQIVAFVRTFLLAR